MDVSTLALDKEVFTVEQKLLLRLSDKAKSRVD